MSERKIDMSMPSGSVPRWMWVVDALLFAVLFIAYSLYTGERLFDNLNFLGLFLGLFVLNVLEKAIYALSWKVFGNLPWSAFSFKLKPERLSISIDVLERMPINVYRIGFLLSVLLGCVLPLIVGSVLKDTTLAYLGMVMTAASSFNLYLLWTLRKVPSYAEALDHPVNGGCWVILPDGV